MRPNRSDEDLDRDDAQLGASGYKREMPRQFSLVSLLALSYALICTWNGFARYVPTIPAADAGDHLTIANVVQLGAA
jgi:hypothetical protein